jgi:surface protein
MSYMFKDSYDSEPPYDIDFSSLNSWEVSNVQYMDYMFYKLIEGTPELSSWDVSNVTTMNSMFYWAREFNSDISNWNVSNVQDMQTMFLGASIFNQDISGWDTSSVIAMDRMFAGAEAFDQDLSSWDIRNVQSMDGMFSNATLSTANYDALLIGWEAQDVQNNVVFDGGYSKYSAGVAAEARQRLIDEHGWVITDGGQAP